MATRRDAPYVWVTWLAKQMSGEEDCRWKLWFKANHTYDKLPSTLNMADYLAKHDKLCETEQDRLVSEGWEVRKEKENSLAIQGQSGTLGGKPDLVAIKGNQIVVVDCKTGQPRNSHEVQVLLYLWALPIMFNYCDGKQLSGQIIYNNGSTKVIDISQVSDEFKDNLKKYMSLAGSKTPPQRTPSSQECGFCEISLDDCPDRIEEERKIGTTTDF